MNWLLGLIGAMFGVALSDDREILGALLGFASIFLLFSLHRMGGEVAAMRKELSAVQQRMTIIQAQAARSPMAAKADAAPVGAVQGSAASKSPSAPSPMATPGATSGPMPRPAPTPPPRPAPVSPRRPASTPGWEDRLAAKLKMWFTEGNVPVKVGVLVLLFGVAAALKLAAERGYFSLSIEARLALIATAALVGLMVGWRERARRPAFGLSLQGGALGVLLLTVFAAYRLYGLLPSGLAFALVVVLVAGSALLALLQRNMALAVLGFLGGYLAPVLISTGSANHVALFSYYAILNAAVFAISWRQNWRLLNLIGFAFTFGVGTAWGARYYRPEMFASVEPFLVLFFLFYIVIGLLYVIRQTEHRRPWVDGTLVFGTPLVAFPLQAGLIADDRLGLALSALVVAGIYAALVFWLRQRKGERLLTEAYGALALGFATLAVPLAFSASTTASLWALEGAGVAWLGIRQERRFPWIAGLGLQLLAAVAYALSLLNVTQSVAVEPVLLLNAHWLGAAILSFSGFVLALIHDRHRPVPGLPAVLFSWAAFWWLVGGIGQLDQAAMGMGQWRFAMAYLAGSVALATLLRAQLGWSRLDWVIAISAIAGGLLLPLAAHEHGAPLAQPALAAWAVFAVAMAWALASAAEVDARGLAVAHLASIWTLVIAATWQLHDVVDGQALGGGWRFLVLVAPTVLMSLVLWRRAGVFAWPRQQQFGAYRLGWFAPAIVLMSLGWLGGLFEDGSPAPLAFVPLVNPLEMSLIGLGLLLFGLFGTFATLQPFRRFWPLAALGLLSLGSLRAVHHGHGEAWSVAILDSGFTQATLTVVWSLAGVAAWIWGSRHRDRRVWLGGAALMGVVLLKLPFVDRAYMGNMPGIVSFIAVGLLLVGVGYIAPSPPAERPTGEPA